MFKILELLPLLGVTASFFGWCEVSPSPFLLPISCCHSQVCMKSQPPRHLDDPCGSLSSQNVSWTVILSIEKIHSRDSWIYRLHTSPNCFSLSNFWAKFPSSLILSCFKAVLKKLLTQSWPSSASMRHPSVLIKGLALLFNWRVAGGTTAHRLRHSLHHKGTQIVFHL